MFSTDESEGAEVDHVPRSAVLISHQVQCHGNMGVTVITAEVVLSGWNRVQMSVRSMLKE